MIKATKADKKLAIGILADSFRENKSAQYIIQKSKDKERALRELMDYSFEMCRCFGDVFISQDRKGCALVLYPERKKTTPYAIWLDIKLAVKCIGLSSIKNVLGRESKVKAMQKMEDHRTSYLWFVGVSPQGQNKGTGSQLLRDITSEAETSGRNVILETSTLKNLPWYEKFGFTIYNKLELGYTLYFLERTCS
jgi:ribosomal protein S18 acetylase RimI-like enzyme